MSRTKERFCQVGVDKESPYFEVFYKALKEIIEFAGEDGLKTLPFQENAQDSISFCEKLLEIHSRCTQNKFQALHDMMDRNSSLHKLMVKMDLNSGKAKLGYCG